MVLLECKDNTWKGLLSIDEGNFLRASGSQYIDGHAIDTIDTIVLIDTIGIVVPVCLMNERGCGWSNQRDRWFVFVVFCCFCCFSLFLVGSFYYGLATRNTEQQWWYLVVFRCLFGDFE